MSDNGIATTGTEPGEGLRIGLMVPSSNTMMEPDFARELPAGWTLHTARMYLEDTTAAGEYRMLDEFVLPAARDLGTARPHVVVFGCTSAGALRGSAYDRQLCERISELTGAPAVSTIQAVRTAIERAAARRVGVVTPYVDELNDRIRASIEADGVEVVRIAGLGMTENFEIARVPADRIVAFAVEALGGLDIDLVFASCTNFGAMAAIPELAARLHRPVVTSNQAVLAAAVEQARAVAVSEPEGLRGVPEASGQHSVRRA
ncbi:MAG TPA: aspartate/glutamate racemase family protein [Streptosporangiaceae bacterium]|nr:aspartate/glutamate racemase family protein [Streptosporangiaceae bacterium]